MPVAGQTFNSTAKPEWIKLCQGKWILGVLYTPLGTDPPARPATPPPASLGRPVTAQLSDIIPGWKLFSRGESAKGEGRRLNRNFRALLKFWAVASPWLKRISSAFPPFRPFFGVLWAWRQNKFVLFCLGGERRGQRANNASCQSSKTAATKCITWGAKWKGGGKSGENSVGKRSGGIAAGKLDAISLLWLHCNGFCVRVSAGFGIVFLHGYP